MIGPSAVPRIDGDMAELLAHADALQNLGTAHADTGGRIDQTWQGLAAVYSAPEDARLFAATGPVRTVSASTGEDLQDAAAALRTYATDTAAIQARLETLRGEVDALTAAYGAVQDESTAVTLEERSGELSAAVLAQLDAWEAAQLRCANALRALSGASPYGDYASARTAAVSSILVEYGGGTTVTPVQPGGLWQEIYPVDETPPPVTGYPGVLVGPEVLVNVPAGPPPTVVDGPGSDGPPFGPIYDADSAQGGPADDGIKPDGTGKVHGLDPLPRYAPRHWTEEDLEDLSDDLRASIAARQDEALRRGEDSAHRRRIAQEEDLLRNIEKVLGRS